MIAFCNFWDELFIEGGDIGVLLCVAGVSKPSLEFYQ